MPTTPRRRRARTTAPTAAISSRIEASSNGSRNFVSSSSPICAGEPNAGSYCAPSVVERLQAGAEQRDAQLDEHRADEDDRQRPQRRPERVDARLVAADVGDDEDVEHHDRAGVDDDLRGGDELRAQQQEQRRQRQQVPDEREHVVEGVRVPDDADRAREGADRRDEEEDLGHGRRKKLLALAPQRRALERLGEQHLLGEDEVRAVVVRHLVVVAHRDRVERARDLAVAAEDAAAQVDLVDRGVALAGGDAVLGRVLGGDDADAVGRAGGGAQRAADALLQPGVLEAVQAVPAAEARVDRRLLLGVLDRVRLLEQAPNVVFRPRSVSPNTR